MDPTAPPARGAATAAAPAPAPGARSPARRSFAEMLDACAEQIRPYPPAAMFGLAARGYASLYEQLVSCILSIRTYDEVSFPASEALFARARTPREMLALDRETLARIIEKCTYPGQKAETILGLSARIADEYDGETPDDFAALTDFRGVGPKCANLALGVALGRPAISVDVHVHRVVNRWGVVDTKDPKKTLAALEAIVPRERWVDVNRILMPFGKNHCLRAAPRCATCLVRADCAYGRARSAENRAG